MKEDEKYHPYISPKTFDEDELTESLIKYVKESGKYESRQTEREA